MGRQLIQAFLIGMSLFGCAKGESSATPIPAATGIPSPEQALPELPDEWIWEEWEGLLLPLPPLHRWDSSHQGSSIESFNRILMIYTGPHLIEGPSGMDFELLSTNQSARQWIDTLAEENPLSVDYATLQPIKIDDHSGFTFNPQVTGTGLLQTYVFELDSDQLLMITTDVVYPEYVTVINNLQLP